MKCTKTLLLLLCALSPVSLLKAQVITLDSVLSLIKQNNPMLKMYDQQVQAAGNYARMAKAWMPPTVSTGPWQTPYNNYKAGMWMITATQMIPNSARQEANYQYMMSMAGTEEKDKAASLNQMLGMAKRLYYDWIILKKKYDVLAGTDSLLGFTIRIAQARYAYRKEKPANIYRAQAELYELRNMQTMTLAEVRMKNIELNTLMNQDRDFVFDIDTTLPPHYYQTPSDDTSGTAPQRSDVGRFDAWTQQLRLQQEYERSKRLPEFSISYTHMQSLGDMPAQYSLMGMISIPIAPWASAEYTANIQGLQNTIDAVQYQKQRLVNDIAGSVAALKVRIKAVKEQWDNYRQNILPAYQAAFQVSLLAYQQNTEDLFVVLDALRMHRMAEMEQLTRLNELLQLQADYEKEMEIL